MISLTREALYDKVWSTPTAQLKKSFGVSDVAIAKLCKRLQVPKPPRGYWAKLKHGQQLPRTPLPPISEADARKALRRHIFDIPGQHNQATGPRPPTPPHAIPTAAFVTPSNLLSVSPMLKTTHKALKECLRNKWGIRYGRLQLTGEGCLDLRIGKDSIEFSLTILAALIRGLGTKGYVICVNKSVSDRRWTTCAIIGDEPVRFHIEEPTNRVMRPPSSETSPLPLDKWDFIPAGKLKLVIDEYGLGGIQHTWSIHEGGPIDEVLASFAAGLIEIAKALKIRRADNERRHLEWQKEQQRHIDEESRIRLLKSHAATWEETQRYRRFLDALEAAANENIVKGRVGQWLDWARRYVDSIDPVRQIMAQASSDPKKP